ncbi:MAG: HAMP domain-containing protein [Desulfuromonadales bacterium]|nr:HAMP domain-containing protein [Desulfuromonadales bacterium]
MRTLRPNLTVSILAFLSCLLLLTWLLFSLLAFKTAANDLYAQKGEHARMLLATFSSQLPETLPVFPNGMIATNEPAAIYARKLSEEVSFVRLTLLDVNSKPIFSAGRDSGDVYLPFAGNSQHREGSFVASDGATIICTTMVKRGDVTLGTAGLVLSLSAEKARLERSRRMFMAYFAIDFILLLGLGSFILSRIVVTPINRLLAATEKITRGQYGHHLRVSGSAELVRLAESFNDMSATLLKKEQEANEHVAALEKVNADLRQAREEAIHTEKMASIGLLAAGMAHEIGTPLAAIMGYAELVTGEQLDSSVIQDYARRISGDCARIDRIVRGLLDYSRPRAATVESCDVRSLVVTTIDMLSQQGAFKNVGVAGDYEENLPDACVDPHQLQQVMINLLLNSRDAVSSDGKLAVRIRTDHDCLLRGQARSCLRIDVMDNGSGIPDEHLQRIFDPFFTTKAPGKGTGLGLAIAARIIDGFGGRITVRSRPGAGTCFSLWLPVAMVKGPVI